MMNTATTDPGKWRAVSVHDAAYDGVFVYAVRSTGIYCRPSCPSRTAKQENVMFFDTSKDAEAAGYRACKRCRPDNKDRDVHGAAIARACRMIEQAETEPALNHLAADAGLSSGHFQRIFKDRVGLSPKQYAKAVRKHRLRAALSNADSVTGAIYDAGYNASSRAYADVVGAGLSPRAYRRGAAGETIRYISATCLFGDILIASTNKGICAIEFGDPAVLVKNLEARFPRARIEPGGEAMRQTADAVVRAFADPAHQTDLPLDIRGTAFQEQVWRALSAVPAGETVSYGDLARQIGKPGAARAVGSACGANRIAILVPCHRALTAQGAVSGYHWGADRKRQILDHEKKKEPTKP